MNCVLVTFSQHKDLGEGDGMSGRTLLREWGLDLLPGSAPREFPSPGIKNCSLFQLKEEPFYSVELLIYFEDLCFYNGFNCF